MKASDFTTGGNDREKAMSNLLKTEKTDAVNTGLVEKADKSAKALKGDLYSVGKKGTHGAGSTALDAIARKRKKTSAADALDGKSRSQLTGKNALTKKVQSRHNLNKSLKGMNSEVTKLFGGDEKAVTTALSKWCAVHYPSVTEATWQKVVNLDYENGVITTDFKLNDSNSVSVTCVYEQSTGEFSFEG